MTFSDIMFTISFLSSCVAVFAWFMTRRELRAAGRNRDDREG